MSEAQQILDWYPVALEDIEQDKNLGFYQEKCESSIKVIKTQRTEAAAANINTEGFDKILNQLYYLLWQIKERT